MEGFERSLVLSIAPAGTRIVAARSYRPTYLPYPKRVAVRTPRGELRHVVLKKSSTAERIEREVLTLRALAELGMPVPAVLAGPVTPPPEAGPGAAVLLSKLPGHPLPWLGVTSLAEAALTCRLTIEAVRRLHQLTEPVRRH